jgi:transcriptional regulator with XRE-family HTH domain
MVKKGVRHILKKPQPIKSGKVLKKLREALDLSQEEVAFRATLDRTYISLLERDERQPTITTIFGLAEALEMQPYELVKEIKDYVDNNRGKGNLD